MEERVLGRNNVAGHYKIKEETIKRKRVASYYEIKEEMDGENRNMSEISFFC